MSNEGLTERDYKILTAGFLPEEIGNNNGYPYVKRSAIHRRLRLVDPNWVPNVDTYVQQIGDTVTVWGSITLKGVTRHNSSTKYVNAWASKEKGGARIGEADYARELSNTIKKATTSLIFRCAESFEIGLYMKEKREPHTLLSVLNEGKSEPRPEPLPTNVTTLPTTATPPAAESPAPDALPAPSDPPKHWALNGDGEKVKTRMNTLSLTWDDLKSQLEPGKILAKLSDTTLTYTEVYKKMDEIYAAKIGDELERKRQSQTTVAPIDVKCADLRVNDLVYRHGGGKFGKLVRLMHYLGDTEDGVFAEWIVWHKTQLTNTNVERIALEKALTFKVERVDDLAEPPKIVLKEVEYLKGAYAALSGKAQEATT